MSQVLLRMTGKLVTDHTTTEDFYFSVTPQVGYHPLIAGEVHLSRRIGGVLDGLANLHVSDVQINGVGVVGDWFDYSFIGTAAELDYDGTTYALVVADTRYRDGNVIVSFDDRTDVLNTGVELAQLTSYPSGAHPWSDDYGIFVPRIYGECYHMEGVGSAYTNDTLRQYMWLHDTDVSDWELTGFYHGGYEIPVFLTRTAYEGGDPGSVINLAVELILSNWDEASGNNWSKTSGDWSIASTQHSVTYTGPRTADTVLNNTTNWFELAFYDDFLNYVAHVWSADSSISWTSGRAVIFDLGDAYMHGTHLNTWEGAGGLTPREYRYPLTQNGADTENRDRLELVYYNVTNITVFFYVFVAYDKPLAVDGREKTAANRQANKVLENLLLEKLSAGEIGDVLDSDTATAGIYLKDPRRNLLSIFGEYFKCGFFYGFNRSSDFELKELAAPATSTKSIASAKINSHSARQVNEIFTKARVGYKENQRVLRNDELHVSHGAAGGQTGQYGSDTKYFQERYQNFAEAVSTNASDYSATAYLPEIFPSFYVGATRPQAHADRIIDLWGVPRLIHAFGVVNETLDFDIGDTVDISGYGNNLDDDYVVWGYDVECISDAMVLELLK